MKVLKTLKKFFSSQPGTAIVREGDEIYMYKVEDKALGLLFENGLGTKMMLEDCDFDVIQCKPKKEHTESYQLKQVVEELRTINKILYTSAATKMSAPDLELFNYSVNGK